MDYKRCFVQFPHPGGEHKPDGSGNIGWNKTHRNNRPNGHKRKFMQVRGGWIEEDGTKRSGDLWAWGEWEPESDLIRKLDRPRSSRNHPRYLWQPYYVPRDDYGGLHNTDPFIFGDCFLYSNCRQGANPGLKRLGRGSVIAFGSCKKGVGGEWRWWIDTVFVVAKSDLYPVSAAYRVLKDRRSDVFGIVTGGPLSDNHEASCATDERFRLYRGATADDPVGGMFSFFPARPAGGGAGFPRPVIDLPREYFNPRVCMAPKGVSCGRCRDELHSIWTDLVAQVRQAGLVLGTHAEVPPRRAHTDESVIIPLTHGGLVVTFYPWTM